MIMAKMNSSRGGEELSRRLTTNVLPVTVFISVEAFVGFFGNITILLVYSKRYRRINFRYFVLALGILDLTSCCTALPGEVYSQLNWYDYQHAWICKVKSFFNVYTAWGSASILLALAVDRYRKICHPCDWQIRFPVAFRLCVCCSVISACVSVPALILWGKQTYTYEFKGNSLNVSVCEKSGEYAETIYPLLYICGVYLVPVSLMIVVAMALNFVTAWRLFGHHSMTVIRHSLKAVAAISLTTVTSETGTDSNGQTKAVSSDGHVFCIDEERRSDKFLDNSSAHKSVKKQEVNMLTVPSTNLKRGPSNKTFAANDPRKIKPFDDNFSNNEVDTDDYSSGNEPTGDSSIDPMDHMSPGTRKRRRTSRRSRRKVTPTSFHRKRKTLIMLILTSIFAVTMATYIVLTSFVAKPDGILKVMADSEKAVFFFFWRLYFINSVVNPILYGFMDPGFRSGFMSYIQRKKHYVTSSS